MENNKVVVVTNASISDINDQLVQLEARLKENELFMPWFEAGDNEVAKDITHYVTLKPYLLGVNDSRAGDVYLEFNYPSMGGVMRKEIQQMTEALHDLPKQWAYDVNMSYRTASKMKEEVLMLSYRAYGDPFASPENVLGREENVHEMMNGFENITGDRLKIQAEIEEAAIARLCPHSTYAGR